MTRHLAAQQQLRAQWHARQATRRKWDLAYRLAVLGLVVWFLKVVLP